MRHGLSSRFIQFSEAGSLLPVSWICDAVAVGFCKAVIRDEVQYFVNSGVSDYPSSDETSNPR